MRALSFSILIFLPFYFTGCITGATTKRAKGPNRHIEQKLRLATHTGVSSLDPRLGVDYPSAYITKMLFEGLMILGPDGSVEYGIADSYELSSDHKTYTFHLRPSIWSNGDKVTAYDFAYSWRCVIDPSKNTLGKQNFYPIKNVKQIIEGVVPMDQVGIRPLDDNTLEVELDHPAPYFLELAASSSFLPINSKCDKEFPHWTLQQGADFVCNGPFTLEKYSLENDILVKKNPRYWNSSAIKLSEIHIAIIKELTTQLSLFEKGELDWLGSPLSAIVSESIDSLKKKSLLEYSPTLSSQWLSFNIDAFPFSNLKMRKAFALAIDRKSIVTYLLQSNEIAATGVLPPGLATQRTPFFQDGDKKQALQLFEEALEELGITKGELPSITIHHSSLATISTVMQEVQEQLSSTFGIPIKLEQQDFKTLFSTLQQRNFQLGAVGWRSWLSDPIYVLQTFRNRVEGLNFTNWENEEYKELLRLSDEEFDQTKRLAYFNRAECVLIEEMPLIPLYHRTHDFCKNPYLKNVSKDLDRIDFRWAYFEEANAS